MPKYYVAGIPFDGENCLRHYGVKGMKWNQHIFGIDANDKYIKWLKNAGQDIGKFANKAANTVSNAATSAARSVGGALNKSANFVTGNQARQDLDNAKKSFFIGRDGRVKKAQEAYDKTLPGIAEKVANDAGRWTNQAAKDVGNFVTGDQARRDLENAKNSFFIGRDGRVKKAQEAYDNTLPGAVEKAANDVGKSASGFLNSAGKWISTAANDVGREATNAANSVGNAASQAGQWIGDRANDVGKAATDAWNSVSGAANQAGQWIGDRANDVGKAANDAWNGVSGAANDAGRWVGQAAKDVGNFVSGNQARQDLENAKNSFFIGRDGRVNRAQEAYDNTLPGAVAKAANDVGNWVGNAANDVKNWAGNAVNDVGKAANDVGKDSSGFLNSVGKWISTAANDAKNWAGNAVNDVGKAAGSAVNAVGNAANDAGQWIGDRANDVGKAATDAWNSVSGAANQAGQWLGDRAQDVGNLATDAWNGATDAANQAGQWVGNAANDAREWAGQAAKDVGKAASNAVDSVGEAANKAGNWIGDRAREAGEAVGNAAESAKDWATNALDDITGKNRARENHSNQMRDYASEVIDPGYSSRDREKILRDMISAEDDAISKGVANDRFFDGNTGGAIRSNLDMIDYLMNQIPNTPSSGQDKLYEYIEDLRNQNQMYLEAILGTKYPDGVRIRHSDISDKPEGVGEAFWKNYIAHGGTREDYEREWR